MPGWARGRLYDPAAGAAELKKALAAARRSGRKGLPRELFEALLAELEAEAVGVESALARVNEALALAHQGECRFCLAFLHRVRGDLLLKRDPAEPASPRRRFATAIAVAKEQGARSYAPPGGPPARQALSIDRPPRRRPRRPRPRARRLCADARNAGDRRGAGAARGADGDGRGQGRGGAAAATDAVARGVRPSALRHARLRRAGNDGSVSQSPRFGSWRQGRARAIGGGLRLMGRQLRARRLAIDAGACSGVPQRRRRRNPIRRRRASRIASAG